MAGRGGGGPGRTIGAENPFEAYRFCGPSGGGGCADAAVSSPANAPLRGAPSAGVWAGGQEGWGGKRQRTPDGDARAPPPVDDGRSPGRRALEKRRRAAAAVAAGPPALANFAGWVPVHAARAADGVIEPFVSGVPGGWRERWRGTCEPCFARGCGCPHFAEEQLRLLILGHNPSDRSWAAGVAYGNPSNRFWPLLRSSGVIPHGWRADEPLAVVNNLMPAELGERPPLLPLPSSSSARALLRGRAGGQTDRQTDRQIDRHLPAGARLPLSHRWAWRWAGIGITDLGCLPGSEAAAFPRHVLLEWRRDLYARMAAHLQRCAAPPGYCAVAPAAAALARAAARGRG
jgi:hypothetical protein